MLLAAKGKGICSVQAFHPIVRTPIMAEDELLERLEFAPENKSF